MDNDNQKVIRLDDLSDPKVVNSLSDEILSSFSFPLYPSSMGGGRKMVDADGFSEITDESLNDLHKLQKECWRKAESNPQINSHVRDIMGRMAGWGFSFNSERWKIDEVVEEVTEDPRNDLYQNMPKYVARAEIEGEVFFMFTLHKDGFVEIDFIPPSSIHGGGQAGSGIYFHPTKQTFPLFYKVHFNNKHGSQDTVLVPSINIAYYPELEDLAKKLKGFDIKKTKESRADKPNQTPYKELGGYMRFIVHWNRGFLTKRNVSHIKTTIEWVNYYEMLKKYEIDHKKSSGAYLWVISIEDVQAFRRWINMTDAEREKTGIMNVKDPGGTVILPAGMKLEVINPKLSTISEQDTDIMQMVSSGLQKPQDQLLGNYNSTYASVKASQGPQGDRINDELHYFKLFLTYDFWRPILFLVDKAREKFKNYRYVREVKRFENGEPVFGKKRVDAYKFIDISLPMSRLEDVEAIAKAFLGSKHGSIVDTLGIPRREIAKRMGFTNYVNLRKEKCLEDEDLPETLSTMDAEGAQERAEAEPKLPKNKTNEKVPKDGTKKKETPKPTKPVKPAVKK